MLRYVVRRYIHYVVRRYNVERSYATLRDVTLRCEMLRYVETLHYIVRCYIHCTLKDVTLRCETLHYVVRCYATL